MTKNSEIALKKRIKELEAENKKLKAEIKRLKKGKEGFYTIKDQFVCSLDLGKITEKLPTSIPDHKKWKASDYPKEWSCRSEKLDSTKFSSDFGLKI